MCFAFCVSAAIDCRPKIKLIAVMWARKVKPSLFNTI